METDPTTCPKCHAVVTGPFGRRGDIHDLGDHLAEIHDIDDTDHAYHDAMKVAEYDAAAIIDGYR